MKSDWRRARLCLLRYDMPGRLDIHFNELMRDGDTYGHQCLEAKIGKDARVLDVRFIDAGVLILYEPGAE